MNQKTYSMCAIVNAIAVGIVFAFSIMIGNFILPLIAIIIGMTLIYMCKRKVTGVIQDERTYRIAERSSMRTIQILGPATAIIGITVIIMGERGYAKLVNYGYTILWFNIAILGIYMLFYGYYSRKYKG